MNLIFLEYSKNGLTNERGTCKCTNQFLMMINLPHVLMDHFWIIQK